MDPPSVTKGGTLKHPISILLFVTFLTTLVPGIQNGLAQTPSVSVYFDEDLTRVEPSCPDQPPGTVLGTLFVIAEHFPAPFIQLEYRVKFPAEVLYLGEVVRGGSAVGVSPIGIIQTWETPQDASSHLVVNEIWMLWMCVYCMETDIQICVDTHPETGYFRALRWPDMAAIYPMSHTAVACPLLHTYPPCTISPPVPVEETTWGEVKSLYRN